jgi:hypothetical protein
MSHDQSPLSAALMAKRVQAEAVLDHFEPSAHAAELDDVRIHQMLPVRDRP